VLDGRLGAWRLDILQRLLRKVEGEMKPNEITRANAGGARLLEIRWQRAAPIAQFCR
jgi:hypothetical protein